MATGDSTSAQTLGLINADLANNSNGYVTIIGLVTEIDTSAYTDGQQLYLSGTTAGTLTGTKTYAPTHLVYVAVVEYAHAVHGKLFVKVQNGYELDEIHNVSAQSPSNGQTIIYNTSTSLWEKSDTFTSSKIISVTDNTNAALRITQLGTGNALLVEDSTNPDSTPFVIDANGINIQGHTASINFVNPANATMSTVLKATVGTGSGLLHDAQAIYASTNTTVAAPYKIFARSNTTTIGSHATASNGDLIGGNSWQASDGTNFVEAAKITAFVDGATGTADMPGRLVFSTTSDGASTPTERLRITSTGAVAFSGASNYGTSGQVLTSAGNSAPTWTTPTTGTVTSVAVSGGTTGLTTSGGPITSSGTITLSGTLAIANGGTGQTTANTAFNALAPSQATNSGKYLTTDGTNTSWGTVTAGATISNDTTTATNLYPLFAAATSGVPTTIYTGNTKYLYKPSTGELSAPAHISTNGINVNSATVGSSYTIASGNNGFSVGPVTVASGQAVTISSGQRWLVL